MQSYDDDSKIACKSVLEIEEAKIRAEAFLNKLNKTLLQKGVKKVTPEGKSTVGEDRTSDSYKVLYNEEEDEENDFLPLERSEEEEVENEVSSGQDQSEEEIKRGKKRIKSRIKAEPSTSEEEIEEENHRTHKKYKKKSKPSTWKEYGQQQQQAKTNRSKRTKSLMSTRPYKCHWCGRNGHLKPFCWELKALKEKQESKKLLESTSSPGFIPWAKSYPQDENNMMRLTQTIEVREGIKWVPTTVITWKPVAEAKSIRPQRQNQFGEIIRNRPIGLLPWFQSFNPDEQENETEIQCITIE